MKVQILFTAEDVRRILEQKLFDSLPDELLDPFSTEIKCYWKDEGEYMDLDSLDIQVKLETYSTEGERI